MVEIITVEGRHSAIQYNVLHAVLQRLGQNWITGWTHKGYPYTFPSQASYGVYFVRIWEKIDSVITVPNYAF